MSGSPKQAAHTAWRQLLDLGRQLMAQPTIAAQHAITVETAAQLVSGRADLWLAEPLLRLLDPEEASSLLAEPPSDLMRRALDTRQSLRSEQAEPGLPSAVAVPLLCRDTVLGVLQVKRTGGPPFSDAEVELLEGLATQAAVALQATRRVATERWRVEQLSLVRTVSAQVANVLDLDELCRRVTDLILHTFEYYHVALYTLEPGQETLRFRASAGPVHPRPTGDSPFLTWEIQVGQGIVGHAAQTGVEILANDVGQEPRYRHEDALPETRSEVALPLRIEDRVLGVLDVQSDQPDDFQETDMLVLRALADNIAIAVEEARLHSDLRRQADQLSAVAEVSRAITSILDQDTLLNRVVTLIHKQFGYPFVHLFTVDPARGKIVYRAGVPAPSGEGEPEGDHLRSQVVQASELVCSLDDREGIVPWVACHGETLLVNDVSQDPRYRLLALPPANTRAELAVPLIFGDEVLGVLEVQSDQVNAFGDDDRFLFEALAGSVAIALHNADLYRSERWRRQVADGLREVAGLLSADIALDQVLDAILTQLEHTLPCDVVAIWLLHNDTLCLDAVHGYGAELCITDFSSTTDPWLNQALHADHPTIRSPESPAESLGAAMGFPPDYSAIAAPLRAGDRRLGLLTLAHHTPGRYGSESRAMTTAFASHAAVAIENARLYQEAKEQAWISTVMLQVAEATQLLTSLDQVLQTVARLVPVLVGVERCALLLWDEPAAAFLPAAAYGLSPTQQATFDQWHVTPGDAPAFRHLRLIKSPIIIHDTAADPRLPGADLRALGFERLLLLPLLAQGEALGAMVVDYRDDQAGIDTTGKLREEWLAIIQGIAHQAAAAIENTRLREAQQEEAYVSTALLQVANAVVSLNDLDDILSTIVRITPLLVGVERCIIFLWDDDHMVFQPVQAYGLPRDAEAALLAQRYAPGDFPLLDAVRERDRLITYPLDAPLADGSAPAAWLPPEIAAHLADSQSEPLPLLSVPLSMKGDVLGVMLVEESQALRGSRDKWMEIITGIAHQASLAVQNDRFQKKVAERQQLERELQLAREIQRTFMPSQLPRLPGWELAVTWRAARQVAGDLYDFFELPGGRLGLVIADVAGKGMPAALFMVLTRTLVRAATSEETSPTAALARVNDLLVPDARHGMFVTTFYAVLSLETGQLTYANAGHNPPLLLRSGTQELERLGTGGMALGVIEGVQLKEQTVSLEAGDHLILYTDGITEAFSPRDDMYGEERLRATIQAADAHSAQAMQDAIEASVIAFTGDAPPSDDLTLMVLHRARA